MEMATKRTFKYLGHVYHDLYEFSVDYALSPAAMKYLGKAPNLTQKLIHSVVDRDRNFWKSLDVVVDGKNMGNMGQYVMRGPHTYIDLMQSFFQYKDNGICVGFLRKKMR